MKLRRILTNANQPLKKCSYKEVYALKKEKRPLRIKKDDNVLRRADPMDVPRPSSNVEKVGKSVDYRPSVNNKKFPKHLDLVITFLQWQF